jgi:hypothetical protein
MKRIEDELVAVEAQVDLIMDEGKAAAFKDGDRVADIDGDEGTVVLVDGDLMVVYDDTHYGDECLSDDDLAGTPLAYFRRLEEVDSAPAQEQDTLADDLDKAVEAMRDAMGRWVAGRPNSQRDPNTGRFAG